MRAHRLFLIIPRPINIRNALAWPLAVNEIGPAGLRAPPDRDELRRPPATAGLLCLLRFRAFRRIVGVEFRGWGEDVARTKVFGTVLRVGSLSWLQLWSSITYTQSWAVLDYKYLNIVLTVHFEYFVLVTRLLC